MYRKKPEQQLPRWVMTRESMDVQRWFLNKKSNGKGCRYGSLFFFLSDHGDVWMPRSGLFFFWKTLLYSEGDTPLCFLKRRLKYSALS